MGTLKIRDLHLHFSLFTDYKYDCFGSAQYVISDSTEVINKYLPLVNPVSIESHTICEKKEIPIYKVKFLLPGKTESFHYVSMLQSQITVQSKVYDSMVDEYINGNNKSAGKSNSVIITQENVDEKGLKGSEVTEVSEKLTFALNLTGCEVPDGKQNIQDVTVEQNLMDDNNKELVSEDMMKAVEDARAKIVSGEVVVHDYMSDNNCPY